MVVAVTCCCSYTVLSTKPVPHTSCLVFSSSSCFLSFVWRILKRTGFIENWFNYLYDNDVVPEEVFLTWEKDTAASKDQYEGKVCVFVWLSCVRKVSRFTALSRSFPICLCAIVGG